MTEVTIIIEPTGPGRPLNSRPTVPTIFRSGPARRGGGVRVFAARFSALLGWLRQRWTGVIRRSCTQCRTDWSSGSGECNYSMCRSGRLSRCSRNGPAVTRSLVPGRRRRPVSSLTPGSRRSPTVYRRAWRHMRCPRFLAEEHPTQTLSICGCASDGTAAVSVHSPVPPPPPPSLPQRQSYEATEAILSGLLRTTAR